MTVRLCAIISLSVLVRLQGQTFEWANSIGGNSYDNAYAVTSDDNFVYITGGFADTADFDPGPGVYTLVAQNSIFGSLRIDPFVAKYDKTGKFIWARQFAGNGPNEYGIDICVDKNGNVYTCGRFSHVTDFDPGPGTYTLGADKHGGGMFLTKLDANGDFIWAITTQATYYPAYVGSAAKAVCLDNSENILVCGEFNGTLDFDPGPGTYTLDGSTFILKVNPAGQFVWAGCIASAQYEKNEACYANDIRSDLAGNILLTGSFLGTMDFDPGPGVTKLSSPLGMYSCTNPYLIKLSGDGTLNWAKSLEATGNSEINAISTNNSGEIFCTGVFSGICDFDPGSGSLSYNGTTLGSLFLLKVSVHGDLIWAKAFETTAWVRYPSIDLDQSNHIYLTTTLAGNNDLDPGPNVLPLNGTPNGPFAAIAKFSGNGNINWAYRLSGIYSWGSGIDYHPSGYIYTAGTYGDSIDFDPSPGHTFGYAGSQEAFLHKLSTCPAPDSPLPNTDLSYTLCPDESVTFNAHGNGVLSWFQFGDSTIAGAGNSFATPKLPAGRYTYFATVSNTCNTSDPLIFNVEVSECADIIVQHSNFLPLKMYPNPASDYLVVDPPTELENSTVQIISAQGSVETELVISQQHEFDVRQLAAGLYLVRIQNKNGEIRAGRIIIK